MMRTYTDTDEARSELKSKISSTPLPRKDFYSACDALEELKGGKVTYVIIKSENDDPHNFFFKRAGKGGIICEFK